MKQSENTNIGRDTSGKQENSPCKIALSPADASRETGICRTKLYEAINNGDLRARKLGSRTVILREDLGTFLGNLPSYKPKSK